MKPNIIYILADDMGYGDVSCLNENSKIKTKHLDKMASEGIRFTDAHSTSAVCTPSRYGILTGRYNWRKLQEGIVPPFGDTIIPPERKTVANLLQENGYETACFGKWHLGMSWQKTTCNGEEVIDYTKPVKAGPTTNGFDYYFGVDVPNWPPYCFIENKNTIGIPTIRDDFPLPTDLTGANLTGACVDDWDFKKLLPTFSDKISNYIDEHANKENPFFLYFPLTSPHEPIAVNDEWVGKSGLNSIYADFVMETDDIIGKIIESLKKNNIEDDTLIIFTSDNGKAKYSNGEQLENCNHFSSYNFRGYKADIWDGGHRIPFIAKWPKIIKPDTVNDNLLGLCDLFATVCEIVGITVPDTVAEDSRSFYSSLCGDTKKTRKYMVNHSITGKFAIRDDKWKLILCAGSGGFQGETSGTHPFDSEQEALNLPKYQLYDIVSDVGEKNNLYLQHKDIAKKLVFVLEDYVARGRSTDGENQANDIQVILDPEEINGEILLDD